MAAIQAGAIAFEPMAPQGFGDSRAGRTPLVSLLSGQESGSWSFAHLALRESDLLGLLE